MTLPLNSLFDTHIHLDLLPPGFDDQEEMKLAEHIGVGRFVVPGVEPSGWERLLAVASSIRGGLAAPGIHPLAARQWEKSKPELRRLLTEKRVAAVGEIGLDGALESPAQIQEQAFRGQLRLARDFGLPVLLHCRKATGKLLEILKQEGADEMGGIWHNFSGSPETARAAISLNFALAFGGIVTWPEARRAPETLKEIPAEWIVLESDAPDMTPHPHRGEPNRPLYLGLVAEKVAALRGWSLEETAAITTANACRVLRLESLKS
ncbi:MAG: TatD family hydrolase [Syntrophotaleaceae bacterium]